MKITAVKAIPVRLPRPQPFTSSLGASLDPDKLEKYRIDC